MSDRVITNVFQGNYASGSNIRQYESADVDVTAVANANQSHGYPWYHYPATGNANTDVTTTVAQSNAASGNNITQVANADVDVTAVANANGHGGYYPWYPAHGGSASTDVNTFVGQSNQASGNGITQVSNADVDITAISNANNGFGHLHGGGTVGSDIQTVVAQQNAASGNGITQVSNADVDVFAATATYDHGHGWFPHVPQAGGAHNDVATTIVQANQAAGNGIYQYSGADVDVSSFVSAF